MPVQPLPCGPAGGGGESPGDPGTSCCSPSITSMPMCLADGTPVMVVLRSPCVCGTTEPAAPEVAGWLDPTSGVFTAGGVPTGAGPCAAATGCGSVSVLELCDVQPDGTAVTFLRHVVHDCDGMVTSSTDTAADGTTAYTPTGIVGDCPECVPVPMCPQLLGLTGPEVWTAPDGTESVHLTVVCAPVAITDCTGNQTVVNECGPAFSWSATGSPCTPGELCGLTVDVPDGAAVYVQWLSPCTTVDES